MNENTIEQAFIHEIVKQGYTYYYGPDIAPYSSNPQRNSFESAVLEQQFLAALEKLNSNLNRASLNETYQKVLNLGSLDVMENNEHFHTLLTNGVTVEQTINGVTKGVNTQLIDFKNPENNQF